MSRAQQSADRMASVDGFTVSPTATGQRLVAHQGRRELARFELAGMSGNDAERTALRMWPGASLVTFRDKEVA